MERNCHQLEIFSHILFLLINLSLQGLWKQIEYLPIFSNPFSEQANRFNVKWLQDYYFVLTMDLERWSLWNAGGASWCASDRFRKFCQSWAGCLVYVTASSCASWLKKRFDLQSCRYRLHQFSDVATPKIQFKDETTGKEVQSWVMRLLKTGMAGHIQIWKPLLERDLKICNLPGNSSKQNTHKLIFICPLYFWISTRSLMKVHNHLPKVVLTLRVMWSMGWTDQCRVCWMVARSIGY